MQNRFGLFIHWGHYASFGLQEQAFARYAMDRKVYEGNIQTFNPVNYDPEEWVALAKSAGMEYICFTAKHHDGFCMWDTKYTDYSIMHTPYGRDVLKMLADACRKQGMRLSIYYSIPDWHHPNSFNPHSTHQWRNLQGENDFEAYLTYVRNQVTELLTNYGSIYTFFWDISPGILDRSMNDLVRQLQPEILINNRGFDPGDFSTPEREYEGSSDAQRYPSMTEACNALGEQSWGYRAEEDLHSVRYLTCSIDQVMAMGGSYLLNIGPRADGSLDPEHVALLQKVGNWYQRMEGCLVGHSADPFCYNVQKNPCIVTRKGQRSYFHFYNGLISSAVAMENYPSLPKSVRLCNTGEALPFAVTPLPEYIRWEDGTARQFLHISHIPVDALASEPIVLEITW